MANTGDVSVTTESQTKKKPAKKKRRISKHVLQAQKEKATEEDGAPAAPAATTPPVKTEKKKLKVKDPSEATNYLNAWKAHKSDASSKWKFNKNTQSWLIRHMYEADKVPKNTFGVLLEYLDGLKGGNQMSRMLEEATRRALRYKSLEKDQAAAKEKEDIVEEEEKKEKTDEESKDNGEEPKPVIEGVDKDADDEEARWQRLDEHEKRKEYKRARKVLETFKG